MALSAQTGVPLTFFHPVRDNDGAFVAGQAASVTSELLAPDRAAATEAPALSDFATGWVLVTLTLTDSLGEYTLKLTNPSYPTADGRQTEYPIVVTAGIGAAQYLLTSLQRVRTRMQLKDTDNTPIEAGDTHEFDTLINSLVSEVSDDYQNRLGRTIAELSYTEYLDGSGRASLVLGAGPLVSIASVESVEYEDDGAGGVTETLTTVEPYTYVAAGLRSQPRYLGLGRIDKLGAAVFTRGARRYKVIHTSGFDPIPEGLVGTATEDVVSRLMTRTTGHLISQTMLDGTISYLRPGQMEEMRENNLRPYRVM